MKLTTTLVTLAFAATAIAAPVESIKDRGLSLPALPALPGTSATTTTSTSGSAFTATPVIGCLLGPQATNIVNAFKWLAANPKASNFAATANALLASNFQDWSDSLNQLTGAAEGTVTFASPAAFISASEAQNPLILDTLDIFFSCNAIVWRWITVSGAGNDSEKVKGISTFYINPQGQIQTAYAEFNSGAWLVDLGKTDCVG